MTAEQARAMMGAGIKITNKGRAERLLNLFDKFEIYSWNTECGTSDIFFRNDGEGRYTIVDEEYGTIRANRREVIDYIYRNRKYINYWISNSDKEYWYTAECEEATA